MEDFLVARIRAPEVARPGADTAGPGTAVDPWPVTALLFLEARDLSEAAELARTHPGTHFGASVEVRPWSPAGASP